jgi:hypothetical protein
MRPQRATPWPAGQFLDGPVQVPGASPAQDRGEVVTAFTAVNVRAAIDAIKGDPAPSA